MVDFNFYDTHSTTTSEWYTPPPLFKELDQEFNFITDAEAEPTNRLGCPFYFTKEMDGLRDYLTRWKGPVFINPPYSDGNMVVYSWVKASSDYNRKTGYPVVMLLRSTTEVKWFHDFVWDKTKDNRREGVRVKFPDRRIEFIPSIPGLKIKSGTTFASIIVIFQQGRNGGVAVAA